MVVVAPYTGCGIEISARALTKHFEAAGYRHASAALTCLFCASERLGDGDKIAAQSKQWTFGALYGFHFSDMDNALGLRPASQARMRSFSQEFRRRLARRLLP